MHEGGGTVWNTSKGGGTEKREGKTKILKKEGKLGQGVGALKGGLEPPYEVYLLSMKDGGMLEPTHTFLLFK